MSNSDIAVSVRGLSKSYTIAHNAERHTTAAEALMHRLKHPFQKQEKETFWALKDVEFDIKKGDVVGIIGRNGAGKSTLLKILSRITEPTTGQIDLYGRVGSLLEVGTGFHPELTGRENIFLNGAILGMSKREIAAQFDAIVDFSGTEQFIDTPVKRYSSGMYVRLAFAVAAHLNPEILIVDEVLAVGDAEFQKKCLGKMKDVASSGRTVLFVSHTMQAISVLCNKGCYLENGSIGYLGDVQGAIGCYLGSFNESTDTLADVNNRAGSGEFRLTSCQASKEVYKSSEKILIFLRAEKKSGMPGQMYCVAYIYNDNGQVVAQCDSRLGGVYFEDASVVEGTLCLNSPWLKQGSYQVDIAIIGTHGVIDACQAACRIHISSLLPYRYIAPADSTEHGVVFADFGWSVGRVGLNASMEDETLLAVR